MERIEVIRKHLGQYTTLRHETDMFNQSVSFALGYVCMAAWETHSILLQLGSR